MHVEIAGREDELKELCRRYHVRRLDLFGSAAGAEAGQAPNDFDFLVEFDPAEFERRPAAAYADAYFGLLESLERLLGLPVDLVVAGAIRNPYFRASIEATKASIYAA